MAWCGSSEGDEDRKEHDDCGRRSSSTAPTVAMACRSCSLRIQAGGQGGRSIIQDPPGLPFGVKFDPTDPELLEHLEGKARPELQKLHPLIDEFIPTIEGENGICYTHPEKLPGVTRDGIVRHFFHRPSRAYTTGTRKRRKVNTDEHGSETRWHKTGKTRPVFETGKVKGYKKILVLYTNYGKQRKPEKTNWVMHQYHLGSDEDEKDGELVVSKVFYQTQPRQCGSTAARDAAIQIERNGDRGGAIMKDADADNIVDYYSSPPLISYGQGRQHRASTSPHLIPSFNVHAGPPPFSIE